MDKQLLSSVVATPWFVAVYAYAMSPDVDTTVIIVEEFTSEISAAVQRVFKKDKQVIIVTRNDLEYGNDVYSIPLLHMQIRSVCERWDDVLWQQKITSGDIRPHLEGMIRHVLIDLREAIVRKSLVKDVKKWLIAQYDRILCWCAFYVWMEAWFTQEEMETVVDTHWEVNCLKIGQLLENVKTHEDLLELHQHMYELVTKVDWLG